MAKISVFLSGTLKLEKQLEQDHEYVLGRGSQCEIRLDHPEVSRQHAKLRFDGQNWNVEVLSRFGRLLVNGHAVETLSLTSGAQFVISPFEIKFDEHGMVYEKMAGISPADATMRVVDDRTNISPVAVKSVLLRLDDQGEPAEEITLGSGVIDAGRSRSCAIKLEDEKASRKHFTLLFDGSNYMLTDQGSPNGTYVNGQKVTTHALQSGDEIKVGKETFRFELMNPEFENLPAVQDKTEVAVIKMTPQYSPGAWNQGDMQNYKGHVNAPVILKKNFLQKLNNRTKSIALVLIAGVLYLLISGEDSKKQPTRNPASQGAGNTAVTESAAFDKLSREQKKFLEDTYNLALNLYTSGKYDLAALEITKIFQIIPNYKDAKNIQALCQQALEIKKQQDEAERRKKEQDELLQKVSGILDGCEKLLNAKKYEEVEGCVSQISELDPENSRGQNIVLNAKSAMDQISSSKEEQAARARRKASAHRAFESGKKAYQEKRYPAAINNFEQVTNIAFNDTEGLKQKAKTGLKAAKDKMLEMSNTYYQEGKAALETKDYKNALAKLSKALELSPENGDARIYRERAEKEAHLELKNLYAESVIEENLGNIESAKKKWRLIIETGLKSDSYFDKAKIKLGKYEK